MKPYRVGIIGCGNIANAHTKACKELGLEIAAAADIMQEQLGKFQKSHGVKNLYTDYKMMLQKEDLDIAVICTWPPLHAEMTVAAAESGVSGIICEKPMAVNLAEADAMIEACDKNKAKLVVGHMRRFSEAYAGARRLIVSGAVGEVYFIHGVTVGDLLSDGTHMVDMIRFFAGDAPVNWVVGQVDARSKKMRYGHYVEDSSVGYFEFENGVRAFLEIGLPYGKQAGSSAPASQTAALPQSTTWWRKLVRYTSAFVLGTEGRIEVGEREVPPLRYMGKGDTDWRIPSLKLGVDPFTVQLKVLTECIEKGTEHPCNGRQGRAALEILIAVHESARRRAKIILPLAVKGYPLAEMIESNEI
jgi:predicted dehydrogenase